MRHQRPLAEDFPSSPTEIVRLTEDAETLELLFAYVYPGAYPSLKELYLPKTNHKHAGTRKA